MGRIKFWANEVLSAVVELERKIWATRLQIKALQETAADLQIDSLDGLISEMSARLENLEKQKADTVEKVRQMIASAADVHAEVRKIFLMRYVEGRQWQEIAGEVYQSESNLFVIHRKYLKQIEGGE